MLHLPNPIIHPDEYNEIEIDSTKLEKELKQKQEKLILKQKDLEAIANQFMDIGETQGNLKNFSEEIKYYKAQLQLLEIAKVDSSKFIVPYEKLMISYKNLKNYSKLTKYALKFLDLFNQKYGEQHQSIIKFYYLLSKGYFHSQQYAESLQYSEKALELINKIDGFNDYDTHCLLLYQIGLLQNVHEKNQNKELEFYLKALEIRKKHSGEIELKVADYNESVGQLYKRSQHTETKTLGLGYYQEALKIRKILLGNNHPLTFSTYKNIIKIQHDIIVSLLEYKSLKIQNFRFNFNNEELLFLENEFDDNSKEKKQKYENSDSEEYLNFDSEQYEKIILLQQKLNLFINEKSFILDKFNLADKTMKQQLHYVNRRSAMEIKDRKVQQLERNLKKYFNNKLTKWYSKEIPLKFEMEDDMNSDQITLSYLTISKFQKRKTTEMKFKFI